MRIIRCFSHVKKGLNTSINHLCALSISAVILGLFSQQVTAYQIELEIVEGSGGKISGVENDSACTQHCKIQTFSKRVISLFAIADEGYRFAGWDGACNTSFGLLCTIKLNEDSKVSAKFVKTDTLSPPTQALLLLHDINEKNTVWNEFVKQRFDNHCPVIYGGVLLDKDTFDAHSNSACYRIKFGYYGLLHESLAIQADSNKAKPRFSRKHLSYEIRAAVLGLLNQHPNLNLTLVSHGHAASAARSFLHSLSDERKNIAGLLALSPNDPVTNKKKALVTTNLDTEIDGVVELKIDANPKEGRMINAALVNLANTKWPLR